MNTLKLKGFIKILGQQRGFTVTEMLVAVAIGGVAMAAIASGLTAAVNMRQRSDQKTETSLLSDRLTAVLSNKEKCTAQLSPVAYDPDTETPITIDGMSEGMMVSSSVRLKEMKLLPTPPAARFKVNDGLYRHLTYVRYVTESMVNGVAVTSRPRTIPLRVAVSTATGRIETCKTELSQEDICLASGGTYDASAGTPDALRCKPRGHCQYAGSYTTAPIGIGGFGNRAMNGAQACPADYTTQRAGSVALATSCGKNCATTTSYPVFNCVRCGDALAAQPAGVSNGAQNVGDWSDLLLDAADGAGEQDAQARRLQELWDMR
jgi:prepilin-type N-terminal cleavage/methylation domain-containing protein